MPGLLPAGILLPCSRHRIGIPLRRRTVKGGSGDRCEPGTLDHAGGRARRFLDAVEAADVAADLGAMRVHRPEPQALLGAGITQGDAADTAVIAVRIGDVVGLAISLPPVQTQ